MNRRTRTGRRTQPKNRGERTGGTRTRRLLELLRNEVRAAGHGAIGRLEKRLGRRPGWLRERVRAGRIELSLLFDALDALGIDALRFFRRALAREGEEGLDVPAGEPPRIVALARRRKRFERGRRPGRPYLDELDRLRYRDPRRVVELAEGVVEHVAPELLPRLLGIAGSAYRILLELDHAEHAIVAGLELARECSDAECSDAECSDAECSDAECSDAECSDTECSDAECSDATACGELMQRLAYVAAERGDVAEALQLTREATIPYLEAGDLAGVGRCFVDLGRWLFDLGRTREAVRQQEAALGYLPAAERRNRFTAHQCLGLYHLQLGHPGRAREHAAAAAELVAELGDWPRAKLLWLRASIDVELGELERAEAALAEAVEIFRRIHHGETALVTIDRVRLQLLRGRPDEAHETARTMLRLVEPLSGNRVVAAAVAELLRVGAAGLELRRVEAVRVKIEEARERRGWRSLAVGPRSP